MLTQEDLVCSLPHTFGVYLFYGENSTIPLYIGKSIDIKKRVLSHFSEGKRSAKKNKLMSQVKHIEYIQTAGELGALLIEARLIKKYLPLQNKQLRKCKSIFFMRLIESDEHNLSKIEFCEGSAIHFKTHSNGYGMFKSKRAAMENFMSLCQKEGLCFDSLTQKKLNRPCFAYQLKQCKGLCCGKETLSLHNQRLLSALESYKQMIWPYPGAIGIVEKSDHLRCIHIVDQWRHIDTVKRMPRTPRKDVCLPFDSDHYRILSNYLVKNASMADIIQL